MTDEERFVFDLDGYIVVKGVLSSEEIDELNELADGHVRYEDGEKVTRSHCTSWGPPAYRLIDHPRIVPYLLELVGPKFRLDHDYSIFMTEGAPGMQLHGGEWGGAHMGEMDHWYRYRDGVMRNGLTVVVYATMSAAEGEGGFMCIPGTHKSHFLGSIPDDVRHLDRSAHYLRQPEVDAGDVLIFTEALIHGTAPWTAQHERRALLYKYSPGHSAWASSYYELDQYDGLTDQQKRILSPPSIGRRPDVVQPTES